MNKTVRNISVVLLLIVAGALLIVPKLLSDKNKEPVSGNPNQQNQMLPADAVIVKTGELENEVSTVGTVVANEEVEIKSDCPERLQVFILMKDLLCRKVNFFSDLMMQTLLPDLIN